MRLWSIHPRYLDAKGLVAAWREGLLAQAVLAGRTRGYARHPQLERFRSAPDPPASLERYLTALAAEAGRRGYSFDEKKIDRHGRAAAAVPVGRGQLRYEALLLASKLSSRDPGREPAAAEAARSPSGPEASDAFVPGDGGVAGWERARPDILAAMEEEAPDGR